MNGFICVVKVPVLEDLGVGLPAETQLRVVRKVVHAISSVALLLNEIKIGDLQS